VGRIVQMNRMNLSELVHILHDSAGLVFEPDIREVSEMLEETRKVFTLMAPHAVGLLYSEPARDHMAKLALDFLGKMFADDHTSYDTIAAYVSSLDVIARRYNHMKRPSIGKENVFKKLHDINRLYLMLYSASFTEPDIRGLSRIEFFNPDNQIRTNWISELQSATIELVKLATFIYPRKTEHGILIKKAINKDMEIAIGRIKEFLDEAEKDDDYRSGYAVGVLKTALEIAQILYEAEKAEDKYEFKVKLGSTLLKEWPYITTAIKRSKRMLSYQKEPWIAIEDDEYVNYYIKTLFFFLERNMEMTEDEIVNFWSHAVHGAAHAAYEVVSTTWVYDWFAYHRMLLSLVHGMVTLLPEAKSHNLST